MLQRSAGCGSAAGKQPRRLGEFALEKQLLRFLQHAGTGERLLYTGLTVVATPGSSGSSGCRKPPLVTPCGLGHKAGAGLLTAFRNKGINGKVMIKIQNGLEFSLRQSNTSKD